MKKILLLSLLSALALSASAFQEMNKFTAPDSLKGWRHDSNATITADGLRVDANGTVVVDKHLPLNELRSKRVILEVEVKGELEKPEKRNLGGRFALLHKQKNGVNRYAEAAFPYGKFDWQKIRLEVSLLSDVTDVRLDLGAHKGKGVFYYRNLKITAEDTILDFRSAMNMGYADAVSGDGKGGWSDQGPANDASGFPRYRNSYAGIPFQPIMNPSQNDGKTTVLFANSRFPAGVKEFTVDLSGCESKGKHLYLLHALTFGAKQVELIGSVEVLGENGASALFQIRNLEDVADWWNPRRFPNACPAAAWPNKANGRVGVYASMFPLPVNMGKLKKITFRSASSSSNWHLIAATVSPVLYPFPTVEKFVIKEDANWKPMPKQENCGIVKGSALDLSAILPWKTVEETGRVMIRKDGLLEFEKEPGKIVRFLTATTVRAPFYSAWGEEATFDSHRNIEEYCIQLRRAGYNMIRFHMNDTNLVTFTRPAADFAFSETLMDKLDYLLFCMKKYGIYLNVDAMASRIGYSAGEPWADRRNYKFDIHFSQEVRNNWEKGFLKFLTHKNPYTGTRLIDDPVLAMTVCYNEQEGIFFSATNLNFEVAKPAWRAFLKERYKTFDALKKSWGEVPGNAVSFETLPAFSSADMLSYREARGRDFTRFAMQTERDMADWYIATLRKHKFPGMITSVNMGVDFRYILLRSKYDAVVINGYHAHPMGGHMEDVQSSINPASSVGVQGKIIREFASVRLYGKPIINTEHGHGFWNSYRYEQGFIVGAYAALQDFSGLSAFGSPIALKPEKNPIRAFQISKDPVLKVSEFLTALMYSRRDVAVSDIMVRLAVDEKMVSAAQVDCDGINSEQTKLGLVTKIASDVTGEKSLKKNEIMIPALGGSKVFISQSGLFQNTQDADPSTFNADSVIADLKKKKLLNSKNRTNVAKGIFESSTGELFMDSPKKLLSVNTPRLQGACLSAGSVCRLADFSIEKVSDNGNLAIASVDGTVPLSDAKRMVLVYVTDALNTNMEFENSERTVRLKMGTAPALLKTGTFAFSLKNRNAAKMRLYALRFDGTRAEELPLKKSGNTLFAEVDTGKLKEGVSFYFELVEEN